MALPPSPFTFLTQRRTQIVLKHNARFRSLFSEGIAMTIFSDWCHRSLPLGCCAYITCASNRQHTMSFNHTRANNHTSAKCVDQFGVRQMCHDSWEVSPLFVALELTKAERGVQSSGARSSTAVQTLSLSVPRQQGFVKDFLASVA